MAKLITILSNVWNEPQEMVYQMMFQQSGSRMNSPCISNNVGKKITDPASFEISPSDESTDVLYTKPNVISKSIQAGSGLKKFRNANIQCGVPHKKLQNKSVNYVYSHYKLDCQVGPSLVNLKNDAQTNPTVYKTCQAHREAFEILTNWPQRAENSRLRKKNSTSYYGCIKTHLLNIGKAFVIEKIQLPTYYAPEQRIMKLYKCLSLENVTSKKTKMTLAKEKVERNKGTFPIKTKVKCTYTQTVGVVCHVIQEDTNMK